MKQLFRCADHYIQSRDWKMKVVPSNELVTKKIYDKAQPHDSDS